MDACTIPNANICSDLIDESFYMCLPFTPKFYIIVNSAFSLSASANFNLDLLLHTKPARPFGPKSTLKSSGNSIVFHRLRISTNVHLNLIIENQLLNR